MNTSPVPQTPDQTVANSCCREDGRHADLTNGFPSDALIKATSAPLLALTSLVKHRLKGCSTRAASTSHVSIDLSNTDVRKTPNWPRANGTFS